MDRQALSALWFSATRWASRLTWPWMAAAGLLVFSCGMYLSAVIPAQRELGTLRQHISTLQRQLHVSERSAAASIHSTSPSQLAVFYNYFPAEDSMPDGLEKIMSAAADNKLLLKQGDYRLVRDKGGKLLRYQIKLPISGAYLNIRKFLSAVLSDIPSASIDSVKFERPKIGDSNIESTIEMTLYFGRAS